MSQQAVPPTPTSWCCQNTDPGGMERPEIQLGGEGLEGRKASLRWPHQLGLGLRREAGSPRGRGTGGGPGGGTPRARTRSILRMVESCPEAAAMFTVCQARGCPGGTGSSGHAWHSGALIQHWPVAGAQTTQAGATGLGSGCTRWKRTALGLVPSQQRGTLNTERAQGRPQGRNWSKAGKPPGPWSKATASSVLPSA